MTTRSNPKFRSKFEKRVWENTEGHTGIEYEPHKPLVEYSTKARYIPDFKLPNGVLVECKGYFNSRDRAKMLKVKKQNPCLDIRMLFQRASNRITKSPNSLTYGEWASKHGFPWSEGDTIPEEWYNAL
jgi:hypothetical protein